MAEETTLDRVRNLFKKHNAPLKVEMNEEATETPTEEKVEFLTATLEDGTEVHTDAESWAEGSNAYVMSEDGEKVDLPSGEYQLTGGPMITVENGVVTAVAEAEAVEEEMSSEEERKEETEEATEKVEQSEDETIPSAVASTLEKMANTLRTEFKAEIKEKDGELEKLKVELAEKDKEIARIKAEFEHEGLPKAPVQKQPITRKEIAEMSIRERVTAIRERYN